MILVTGATGFIGREVVRRLLMARRPVIALARGRHDATTAERVVAARALLEGLAGGRLRRWAHLSTAYVCGRRSGTILERDGDVGQAFNNVYERVKLESERVLRAAGVRFGVDVRVFRPSIVVGAAPPTAGGNPSNLFFGFIRLVAALAQMPDGADVRLRIEAAPRARFNIVPVGYVASAVCALAERPGGAGETFHLVVRDAPTQAAMLRTITERLGVRGLALVDGRTEPLADPSALLDAIRGRS